MSFSSKLPQLIKFSTMAGKLPAVNRKLIVTKISQNFREATEIVDAPMPQPGPGQLLVRNR